jgi:cation:H+ antiporter
MTPTTNAISALFIVAGLALLYGAGDAFVRASAALARRLGVSPLIIGLTIVAAGTSMPELLVSVNASLSGHSQIAVGNVVGSNIFNIAVILGLSALLKPLTVSRQLVRFDTPIMVAVSVLAAALLLDDRFGRIEGLLFVTGIAAYMTIHVRMARKSPLPQEQSKPGMGLPVALLLLVAGLAGLIAGAHMLVSGSVFVARAWGVSEAVIAVTIVAAGTSLPEVATSVVAALRNHPDIAIGNVVGSNIFNLLGILGVASLVSPIQGHGMGVADLGMMAGTALLLLPLMKTGLRISRREGAALLAVYGAYLWYLWP